MAKWAVKAEIEFSTKTNRDNVAQAIKQLITGKRLWSDERNPVVLASGESDNQKPALHALLRFDNKADRDEVALFIEDRIVRVPALSGTVQAHKCWHNIPGANKPCELEEI